MTLNKYKFKTRLIFGFGIIILINIISIIISLQKVNHLRGDFEAIYNHPLAVSNAVREINGDINAIHRTMKDVVLSENIEQVIKETALVSEYDNKIKKAFKTVYDRFLGNMNDVNRANKTYHEWGIIRNEVIELMKQGKKEDATQITRGKGAEHIKKLLNHTQIMIDFAAKKADEFYNKNKEKEKNAYIILIIMLFLLLSLSVLIAVIINNSISKPIKNLVQRVQKNYKFNFENLKDFSSRSEQEMLDISVTQLENVSKELKEFNSNLENKIEERTKELSESEENYKRQSEMYAAINIELIKAKEKAEKSEKIAKELKRKTDLILNVAGEGIYGLDTKGNTTFVNPTAAKLIGWEAEEILGKNQHDILHHSRVDGTPYLSAECPIYAAYKDGQIHKVDNEVFWRKDGSNFFVEYISSPMKDENDEIIGAVVTFKDITERKENEQQLLETNKSLQDMVYVASHDLQIPLVSMEGYASELLENNKDKLDEEGVYCLNRLQANARRMHKLVLSLLDVSRLNTQKNPHETFSLQALVNKIIKDITLTIEKANANISVGKLPKLYADKQRIEGTLRNLLLNSLNYGGTEIGVNYSDNKLYIKDNGIGIPENQLEKVFLPGERLKMSKASGVGMGLTFCQKVIEQHSGKIWAESEGKNKGTCIYIDFNNNLIIK